MSERYTEWITETKNAFKVKEGVGYLDWGFLVHRSQIKINGLGTDI